MSASMSDIKNKIASTQNMSKITKAMQMVSASKLSKSEVKLKNHQQYLATLQDILNHMIVRMQETQHVLFEPTTEVKKTAYLVVTSDRGLVGGYNNNVFKQLTVAMDKKTPDDYKLYVVGKKGFDFARKCQLTPVNDYQFVPDDIIYDDVSNVVLKLISDYLTGSVNEVIVIYSHYVSKLLQMPKTHRILPLDATEASAGPKKDYLFKPDREQIEERVLLDYLGGMLYGFMLNAKLSEHVSRMNAMQNATDNAMEIIHETQLIYNRARQAAITQEITEIVAGSVALK